MIRQRSIILNCDACKAALVESRNENVDLEISRRGPLIFVCFSVTDCAGHTLYSDCNFGLFL